MENVLAYLGLLAVSGLTVWLGLALYRRYPQKPLRYYAIYLAASLGAGFLKIVGNYTSQELLFRQTAPQTIRATMAWVFVLQAWPFNILAVYAAVAMILAWGGKRFSPAGQIAFFVLQAALLALLVAACPRVFSEESVKLACVSVPVAVIGAVNVILLAGLLLALVLRWLRTSNSPVRRGITIFALLELLILAGGYLALRLIASDQAVRVADPLVTFLSNVPPAIYLWSYLHRYYSEHPLLLVSEDRWAAMLAQYRVSDREAEVVRLLVNGKSYREIEAELFISLRTVQSHVYNVYRKLGVKSRWQLLNKLQKTGSGFPSALS